MHGMTVYPSVSWSDERSYDWCFDGDPVGGIVAVSSVGTQQNKESKRLFLRGYEEMMKAAIAGMGDILWQSAGGMRLECDPREAALR